MSTDTKIYIGLVGKPGGGKGAFAKALCAAATKHRRAAMHARFSDILRDTIELWNRDPAEVERLTLELWHLSPAEPELARVSGIIRQLRGGKQTIAMSRENLQKIRRDFDAAFGADALPRAVRSRLLSAVADIIIIDGVRYKSDEALIRSFSPHKIVYIKTKKEARYRRTLERGENAGEKTKTFEEFCKEDGAENERYVEDIGARADIVIDNNDISLDELQEHAEKLILMFLRI